MKKTKEVFLLLVIWSIEFASNIWYVSKYFLTHSMNSDYAGDAVFAKHLADAGHYLFSADWYPTTELYVIHHQLIMVPLFKMCDDYRVVWILTSVVAFLLMSVSIYFFMKCLGANLQRSILAIILVLNPINTFALEFTVHFHGYLFYYILGFCIVGLLCKAQFRTELFTELDFCVLLLFSLLSGLCGIRLFLIIFIPEIVAWICLNYRRECKTVFKTGEKILLFSILFAIFGFFVYYRCLGSKYGVGSALTVILQNASVVGRNILSIPEMVMYGLGINFADSEIISIRSFVSVITAVFWFFVIGKTLLYVWKNKNNVVLVGLGMVTYSSIILNILFMVFTSGEQTFTALTRYFGLAMYLIIPFWVLLIESYSKKIEDWIVFFVITTSLFGGGGVLLEKHVAYKDVEYCWRQSYIDFLQEEDLDFGVSTYWNANITTFLSNDTIEIMPINSATDLGIYRWNTSKLYENEVPQFLLLTSTEYAERVNGGYVEEILYSDENVVIIKYPVQKME